MVDEWLQRIGPLCCRHVLPVSSCSGSRLRQDLWPVVQGNRNARLLLLLLLLVVLDMLLQLVYLLLLLPL